MTEQEVNDIATRANCFWGETDGQLCAHARHDIAALIAEARRLREELAQYSRTVEAERISDIEEERRRVAARCASIASAVGEEDMRDEDTAMAIAGRIMREFGLGAQR